MIGIAIFMYSTILIYSQELNNKNELPVHLMGLKDNQIKAFELSSKAMELYRNGTRNNDVLNMLKEAIRLDPYDTVHNRSAHSYEMEYMTYRILAELYKDLKLYDESLSVYGNIIVRRDNPGKEIWIDIALIWEKKNDKWTALSFYWKAARLGYRCGGEDGRDYLFDAFERLHNNENDIIKEIMKEISEFKDWVSYYHMAKYYYKDNNIPAEEEISNINNRMIYLEKAINTIRASNPTDVKESTNAEILMLKKHYDDAVANMKYALERFDKERK